MQFQFETAPCWCSLSFQTALLGMSPMEHGTSYGRPQTRNGNTSLADIPFFYLVFRTKPQPCSRSKYSKPRSRSPVPAHDPPAPLTITIYASDLSAAISFSSTPGLRGKVEANGRGGRGKETKKSKGKTEERGRGDLCESKNKQRPR